MIYIQGICIIIVLMVRWILEDSKVKIGVSSEGLYCSVKQYSTIESYENYILGLKKRVFTVLKSFNIKIGIITSFVHFITELISKLSLFVKTKWVIKMF